MTVQMKEWEMRLVKIHRAETFFPIRIFKRMEDDFRIVCVCLCAWESKMCCQYTP